LASARPFVFADLGKAVRLPSGRVGDPPVPDGPRALHTSPDVETGSGALDQKRAIRNILLIVAIGALIIVVVEFGSVFLGVH
jgi:hypothetical protein